jgi:hypothetical protein
LFACFARGEVVSGRVWEDGELGGDWVFLCLGCEFWGLFIKRLRIFSMGNNNKFIPLIGVNFYCNETTSPSSTFSCSQGFL